MCRDRGRECVESACKDSKRECKDSERESVCVEIEIGSV